MTLKRYLFLAFGSLMLLFAAVQWAVIQGLTRDFHDALDSQSAEVARHVAEVTVESLLGPEPPQPGKEPKPLAPVARIQGPDGELLVILNQDGPHKKFIELHREEQRLNRVIVEAEQQRAEQAHRAAEQAREAAEQAREAEVLEQEAKILEKEAAQLSHHLERLVIAPQGLTEEEQALIREEIEQARVDALEQARQIRIQFDSNSVAIEGFGAPHQVALPRAPEQVLLGQFLHTSLWALGLSAVIGLGLTYLLAHRLARPLEALDQGCQRLAAGELGYALPARGSKEVKTAIGAFNQMSAALKTMTDEQKTLQSRQHLAELGDIARGLAHALRNPLHTIGLALERLHRAAPEEQAELSQAIQAKLGHMDKTLTAMLTLAANGVDRNERHGLKQLVDDVILELSMAATPVQFDNRVPKELVVTGAHSELRIMVHTLLGNAQEAAPEGSEVVILAEGDEHQQRLQVLDQGPGLSPSVMDTLFQPHQTTKADGAGMGLYLARRLARLWYRGDVSLTNRADGPGACATLTLQKDTP